MLGRMVVSVKRSELEGLTALPARRCSPRFSQSEQRSREVVVTLINNTMKCLVPSACWEGREIHGFLRASGKQR